MKYTLPLTIKISVDKRSKDAPFVAYTPEIDLASCGPTEAKAKDNLHEAVELFLDEVQQKGKIHELLSDLGFQKEKHTWIPPRISFASFSFSVPKAA